jgi:hypothetical protein
MERIIRTVVRAPRGKSVTVAQRRRPWSPAEDTIRRRTATRQRVPAAKGGWRNAAPQLAGGGLTLEQAVQAWLKVAEEKKNRGERRRGRRREQETAPGAEEARAR